MAAVCRTRAKARLAEISERLATLGTQFGQNVLTDEKGYLLVLAAKEELAGLPASLVSRRGADGRRPRPSRQAWHRLSRS